MPPNLIKLIKIMAKWGAFFKKKIGIKKFGIFWLYVFLTLAVLFHYPLLFFIGVALYVLIGFWAWLFKPQQ